MCALIKHAFLLQHAYFEAIAETKTGAAVRHAARLYIHTSVLHAQIEQSVPTWLVPEQHVAQEAVRLRQNYADAYTGWGVSLKELKRKEEAEHCFAQVVRLRPHCALSLGNLAGKLQLHMQQACIACRETKLCVFVFMFT